MSELDLTDIFNECVDRISQGQSLDDCLRRYPQYASSLRPMLETGLLVQRMRIQAADVSAAQTRVKRRFEDALRAPPKRTAVTTRLVYALAAVLIIGFVAAGSLASLSQNSLPGDGLYSVKMFTEGLQRSLFNNDALEANLNQRRIEEIQQLLALGRSQEVAFSGIITAQNGTDWIINSLAISVPLGIPNSAAAHVGDKVEVNAQTSALQTLVATAIQIIEPASTPLSTVTVPAPTLSPTWTITPSLTPTVTLTPIIPTATSAPATQAPTATSSPIPSSSLLTPTACSPALPAGWVRYPIRSGDTLSALASGQSISLAELMAINCITDASRIIVGQTIYLPKAPFIAPTADNSNQGPDSDNSGSSNPTDDHGGDDHSGHGGGDDGSGSGSGGSDDGPGHS